MDTMKTERDCKATIVLALVAALLAWAITQSVPAVVACVALGGVAYVRWWMLHLRRR